MINDEEKEVLSCFYQLNNPTDIGVTFFQIDSTSINALNTEKAFRRNDRSSVIKAVTSSDKKKALIILNSIFKLLFNLINFCYNYF